jgi:hypothetical protein
MIQESDYSNMGEIEREEVQSLYLWAETSQ